MIKFAEKLHPVILRATQPSTTEFTSQHVRLRNAQWITMMAIWGDRTTNATTTPLTFRVFASSAATTVSAAAQGFQYRLSSAAGTDSLGDVGTATTAGYGVPGDSTETVNRILFIDVDPAKITKQDANFVHLRVDARGDGTNPAFGIVGFIEPRYPQESHLSST